MSQLDDRIRQALDETVPSMDSEAAFGRIARRRRRRGVIVRAQHVGLVAAVVVGTAVGILGLSRIFGSDHATRPAGPAPAVGGRLLYTCGAEGVVTGICAIGADASLPIEATGRSAEDIFRYASWAPDGRRFAVTRDIGPTVQIFLSEVDPDGGATYRYEPLTKMGGFAERPSWSPDGTQIAFNGSETSDGVYSDIFVVDVETGDVRQLTDDGFSTAPVWSPDGTQIAYHSNGGGGPSHLWLMRADGSHQRALANTNLLSGAAWSPDGTQIAYASNRNADTTGIDLFSLDLAGGEERQLTTDPGDELSPAWSPDGTAIAFFACPQPEPGAVDPTDPSSLNAVSCDLKRLDPQTGAVTSIAPDVTTAFSAAVTTLSWAKTGEPPASAAR